MLREAILLVLVIFTITSCQMENEPSNADTSAVPKRQNAAVQEEVMTSKLEASFKKDMAYADLRKAVLSEGWTPMPTAECKKNVGGEALVCDRFPELESCSGDGYCISHFEGTSGERLDVTSYGIPEDWNVPGEYSRLNVIEWKFSRSRSETRAVMAIPERFSPYATTQLDGGMACVAGAVTDEDGMSKKPFVYLKEADGHVDWVSEIALPPLSYQARATHCLQQGESLYVLVQADTQPQQTMSQTLLSIVSLRAGDGSVNDTHAVEVPNVSGAYSAWVHGVNNVSLVDGNIIVGGLYFRLDDPEDRRPFKAILKVNDSNSED